MWLTSFLAFSMLVAVIPRPVEANILQSRSILPVAAAFLATVLIAAWTLIGSPAHTPAVLEGGKAGSISIDRSATVLEIVRLGGLACAFVVGCIQGGKDRRALMTSIAVAVSGALYTLIGVLIYLGDGQAGTGARFSGGFLSANSAATLLGVLLVVTVSLIIRQGAKSTTESSRKSKIWLLSLIGCACTLVVGLLLTASRMGFVSTALALTVLILWEMLAGGKRLSSTSWRYLAIGGASAIMMLMGADLLWARFGAVDDDAANRGVIFAAHWQAFLASPAFGHGLGSFTAINNSIMTADNYGALWSIRAAHNVYIQWLEEAGVIGFVPMLVCISICIGMSIAGARQPARGRTVLRGLIAANVVILVHSLTDFSLQVPSIAAAWAFILGLQFAFSRND